MSLNSDVLKSSWRTSPTQERYDCMGNLIVIKHNCLLITLLALWQAIVQSIVISLVQHENMFHRLKFSGLIQCARHNRYMVVRLR